MRASKARRARLVGSRSAGKRHGDQELAAADALSGWREGLDLPARASGTSRFDCRRTGDAVACAGSHHCQFQSRPHDLVLRRQHQGDADHPVHEERQAHPRSDGEDQLDAARLAQGRSDEDGPRPHRSRLGDPQRAGLGRADQHHFRLSLPRHQRDAAPDRRRTSQPEPPYPRQSHGRDLSRMCRSRSCGTRPSSTSAAASATTRRRPRRSCTSIPTACAPGRARRGWNSPFSSPMAAHSTCPDDGSPLTPEDVRKARAANSEIVQQIAEVQELRTRPRSPMQIASLAPSLPQLLGPPRPIERPLGLGTRPTDRERAALTALADEPLPQLLVAPAPANRPRSATAVIESGELRLTAANPGNGTALGRLKWDAALTREPATFVPAPAYDEEHPEELSYRPFPIAPFLTNTASVDDPALARMVHPDFARTLEMLDQLASGPPMRLRPGSQTARVLWAQEFRGRGYQSFKPDRPPHKGTGASGICRAPGAVQPQ